MITAVRLVGIDESDDVFVVGIAQEADGTGAALLFQIPVDPDLVDEIDTYCLTDDRHAVHYGGVSAVAIDGAVLRLTLDEDASEALGLLSNVDVDLLVPDSQIAQLRTGLERVFSYGRDDSRPVLRL